MQNGEIIVSLINGIGKPGIHIQKNEIWVEGIAQW
jgi:hypothetical protein